MKKLLLLALVFISFKGLGQYPNGVQTIGNDSNVIVPKGALQGRVINIVYTDTTEANTHHVKEYPGAQIFTLTDNLFWLRNTAADAWIPQSGSGGTIGHDTVYVADDLYIDTNLNPGFQTIRRLHNDGLVSGGKVIWSGVGLLFYITPSVYYLGGIRFETQMDTVTLDPADVTNGRIDAFIVDTVPDVGKITGTASANPVTPQEDPPYQIVLATILLNAGDTIPTNVTSNMIYNENVVPPEWVQSTTGTLTVDYNNLANPALGSKALYVSSYVTGARLFFQYASTETVDPDMTYSFFIYSNGQFNNSINFRWFNGAAAVSNVVTLNASHGFNPLDSNRYQLVTIPLTDWTWPGGTTFNRIRITMTGTDNSGSKGFYLDAIQLQNGIINIPPPNDFSNKVDSVTRKTGTDSLFYWIKGISKFFSTVGSAGGGSTNSNIGSGYRVAVPNTNNIKTLFNGYAIGIDSTSNTNALTFKLDTSLALTKLMAVSLYQPHITLTTTGTSGAATFVANTLNIPNYAGGGTTDYGIEVASGATTFVFTAVPGSMDDYIISVNGSMIRPTTDYTTSSNTVTIPTIVSGDSVEYRRIK